MLQTRLDQTEGWDADLVSTLLAAEPTLALQRVVLGAPAVLVANILVRLFDTLTVGVSPAQGTG